MLTLILPWFILVSDKKEIGSELRYSRDLCSRKQEDFLLSPPPDRLIIFPLPYEDARESIQ